MVAVAQHAASGGKRTLYITLGVILVAAAAVVVGVIASRHGSAPPPSSAQLAKSAISPTKVPATTAPSTSTTTTTSTLPPPAAGFVAGHVTAVGDSVMLDYQQELEADVPGIDVEAAVSRQWYTGVSIIQQLKAEGQLGAQVVVALSTNGPITDSDFDQMMSVLQGASRVVFVNDHVDQPWQDPNNQVLAAGAARYPNVVIADWATLAAANPSWFGSDGTHLAINGAGTTELAALIASKLSAG